MTAEMEDLKVGRDWLNSSRDDSKSVDCKARMTAMKLNDFDCERFEDDTLQNDLGSTE